MAISVAVWSQDLEPGKRNLYTVENDIRISGASLAADLADPTGRTVVEVVIKIPEDYEFEDEADPGERPPMHKFVLCALTGGKVEQQPLDLVLPEGEEVEFVVKGKNHVHLYGNYIQQNPGDEDSDEDDDEDEFDLDEVPSDVELGLEDDDEEAGDSSRFEEIEDTPASVKTGKRAREDEEMADASTATAAETSTNLSKKEKKRAKKLKNEAGKAAPAPATTTTTTTTTTTSPTKKDKPVEKKEVAKPAEKKDGGKKDGEKKKKSEPKTLPGGVVIEDKTVGSGSVAKSGKKIGMRYIGRLKNGKVFDSNTKGKPFFFTLGKGEVIKGWDEGIQGMLVGGERVLTIPAAKGYGKRGAPPDIPPNSELIFEVKLVEVK
ncbi:peptidylprolyl isomerase fpr3 [Rhizoctonia solani]|uniref:FK506-binding protein n=1 Tax=Rhizoctonia solani TaxID=456999 RepID=A0A8H7H7Q2_9AGAM|nr:Peptidylprolyl isomerase [Rhizoctonia solani]